MMSTNTRVVLDQLRGLAVYAMVIQVLTMQGIGFASASIKGTTPEDGEYI